MKRSTHQRLLGPCGLQLAVVTLAAAGLAMGQNSTSAAPAAPPAPAQAASATPAKPSKLMPYEQMPALSGKGWRSLFDGKSLKGWRITDFAGGGPVEVKQGNLVLGRGELLTGVNLVNTNAFPKTNYELALDAKRVEGQDFFCGLTFPVGNACCTFVIGGWGGGIVGISSIDGNDASMNQTTQYLEFDTGRWYRVRVRVTPTKLEAWLGADQVANLKLAGHRISMRPGEIEFSEPMGIATYDTTGAIRHIVWRPLPKGGQGK